MVRALEAAEAARAEEQAEEHRAAMVAMEEARAEEQAEEHRAAMAAAAAAA